MWSILSVSSLVTPSCTHFPKTHTHVHKHTHILCYTTRWICTWMCYLASTTELVIWGCHVVLKTIRASQGSSPLQRELCKVYYLFVCTWDSTCACTFVCLLEWTLCVCVFMCVHACECECVCVWVHVRERDRLGSRGAVGPGERVWLAVLSMSPSKLPLHWWSI